MSASRKLCLSRKRERELCPEGKHDISDDFQEAATGFRLPKRLRSGKSQGKSKRTMHDLDTEENPASIANKDPPDENTTNASPQDQHLQEHENETSIKENDLQEMEKMLCSESEKLCPSCKVIVPSAVFTAHFKECLQKFKWTRGEYKQKLPEDDREGETNQQEEQLPVLPCPVCKKPFKSKVQRVSHIKACAQGHGLTSEQLLLASRLLEKQTEEWSELGLPSIQQPQNTKPKPQKSVKHTEDLNDPDIAMALALSRSIVEEEVESRTSREEKLFALGMEDIVNEERKVKPVLLPPLESVISNMRKQGKKTARNRKGCGRIYNTALVTRSVEERERLISEKVAVLLTSTDTAEGGWTNSETPRHSTRLVPLVNKPCQLWEAARSGTDEPIHSFYVPDLEPYIIPKERVIGSLFRHLSQVPGRVNTTALHAMDEESDSECEIETTSEVEEFCTQMALAELMGSQEEQDLNSETELEQTPGVMDTQGFFLPRQITKTQEENKVKTSLLANNSGLQLCELNGSNNLVNNCKENATEVKESSNLRNEGVTSPSLEGFLQVYEEKYENIGTPSLKKQNDFDHNSDQHIHDRYEFGGSISETIRSGQNCEREASSQEKDTLQSIQILFESINHVDVISEDETLIHSHSITASCKTNSKKYHAENIGFESDTDSRGQSQTPESNIDNPFNEFGCKKSSGLHSLCSLCPPENNSCNKCDSDKKQLEDSPLHSSRYDKDSYATPKKACEHEKASLETSCMGSSRSRNNSMLQFSGKDYSETNKQLEHEISNSASKEKILIKNNFANSKSVFMINTLIKNWKDILQSGAESDVTIVTSDGSSLTAHSIVLLARCSQLYKESKACGNFIKWDNIPQKTARHFLSYLYTGTCEVTTPGDPLWMELYDVALQYDCSDLVSYMELIYKAERSPVKSTNTSFKRNSLVNSDSNVTPSASPSPSLKIPVVNLEQDLELINSPSDSMSNSVGKFMMDEKTLKPTRLFIEKTQKELNNKTLPEKKNSEFDLSVTHEEQFEGEHQERDEGADSPDLFESFCSRSCTKSSLSCSKVTGISQPSSHVNQDHSMPKEQKNICQEPPKTSSSYKLSLIAVGKEGKKTDHSEDNTGYEQDILDARSNSPLPTLPHRCEEEDRDDNSNNLRKSDSEARITDLLFGDCKTENVYIDSIKKVDCIGDENEEPPIGETVDTHECYISNIWDDFDAGDSPVMVFEEDSTFFSSPNPKVCDKIKSDDKLESCPTPIAHSSSLPAASTPLLHHQDFPQRDTCSNTLQSSKVEESECLKHKTKGSMTAKVDCIKFTEGQPSDETLVNMAAEIEQLDDDVHQRVNEAESEPIKSGKICSTPATRQIHILKSNSVTPQPDYKNMTSPDLKKELQKYGICPLKRKKAVMVLQHVFEQTHPFVTDSETETSFSQTPKKYATIPTGRPKKLQSQMKKRGRSGPVSAELKSNKKNATKEVTLEESASPVKEGEREKDDSEESQLNSSFSSVSSEGSSGYLFGETMFSPEEEDNLSSTQQADLTSQMREMIVNNSDLHRKVLQYEPIFVEDLHAILKSNKIKCSIQALLDVLDDLCLIVRTQANQNRGQMRASRKRKNISQRKNS